jgi:hypothetical protein
MTTREDFQAAFRSFIEAEIAARRASDAFDRAEKTVWNIMRDLFEATGAATLNEVFADNPAMLQVLRLRFPDLIGGGDE